MAFGNRADCSEVKQRSPQRAQGGSAASETRIISRKGAKAAKVGKKAENNS